MCGICGFTAAKEQDRPILKAMCDIMSHRGPDGEGQYLDDGIALGHRRLSLIDLCGGNQPMVRASGAFDSAITSPALSLDGTHSVDPSESSAKGRSTTTVNCENACKKRAGSLKPTRIPRFCWWPISRGVKISLTACAVCSRSPSGIAPSVSCSAPGISSA